MKICVILGASGHAREVYWQVKAASQNSFDQYLFVDDLNEVNAISIDGRSWPIISDWDFAKYLQADCQIGFVVGVGEPLAKLILVEKALGAGLSPLPTIVHPSVIILDPTCQLGSGGLIAANCVLTTNIKIGDYVLLNVGVTVGHDVILEDYVTCAPQVALAGNVHLQKGVNVGLGSVIREQISVAQFVIIGAQACVVKDVVDSNVTLVGVPAKIINQLA